MNGVEPPSQNLLVCGGGGNSTRTFAHIFIALKMFRKKNSLAAKGRLLLFYDSSLRDGFVPKIAEDPFLHTPNGLSSTLAMVKKNSKTLRS